MFVLTSPFDCFHLVLFSSVNIQQPLLHLKLSKQQKEKKQSSQRPLFFFILLALPRETLSNPSPPSSSCTFHTLRFFLPSFLLPSFLPLSFFALNSPPFFFTATFMKGFWAVSFKSAWVLSLTVSVKGFLSLHPGCFLRKSLAPYRGWSFFFLACK